MNFTNRDQCGLGKFLFARLDCLNRLCPRFSGVRVISADGGIDLTLGNDDPSGKLIRQILGAVAEWEKCALVQKLRASRLRIRRAGGTCEGKKPYGHTPEEMKVVETILEHRKSGKSYVAIANDLNAGGIKSRSGKQWHPTQVQRVIQRAA